MEAIIKHLKRDKHGVSNVIVVMLSLVLVVVIVANVVLWSYQMNQFDWERIQENTVITDVALITHSPWFVAQSEYVVNMGSRISGTYIDTQVIDGGFESFIEGLTTFEYGYTSKSSDARVSTTSGIPVNDSAAVLNISLDKESHIFIIYNAGNREGSAEDSAGKGCAINVDGEDQAFSWQSPCAADSADSVTVIWAAFLSAGSHTIQGRFFANRAGYTVGIDTRQIMAYWFPAVTAEYVRSNASVSTTSSTPVDDVKAVLNITLNEESVAFMIYNVGNRRGSAEPQEGKGITLNIDGSDIATKEWQSGYGYQDANSVTIIYATLLTAGSHTVKGRLFSNSAQMTTIDERQLITFCFPTNTVTYGFKESTSSVSTASGSPVNDTEALMSITLTTSSDSLIIYVGGNPHGSTECREGKGALVNVDGADKSNSSSWQCPQARDYADSVMSLWSEQLTAGLHTVQGRFFSNEPGSTSPNVTVSHRQLLILGFPISSAICKLELNNVFTVDMSICPLDYIQTIEMKLMYGVDDVGEMWCLKAYNWTSSTFSDNGFNSTGGHTPTVGWDYYAVNFTDQWGSYVTNNGTIHVKIADEGADSTQTTIDVDFLAIRAVINGTKFTFQNKGSLTSHLVSLWVSNSTYHQRYDIDMFINSGDEESYIRTDIDLPNDPCKIKIVTERGNIAVFIIHYTE